MNILELDSEAQKKAYYLNYIKENKMDKQSCLDLINNAILARENAYAPYSKYRVGAALLSNSGEVFLGCNIENSAYSETVCGERVAFFSAISKGVRDFKAIAIVGGKDKICSFASPCGACRQVMQEFCKDGFKVILFDGKDIKTYTLSELLPSCFNSSNLK